MNILKRIQIFIQESYQEMKKVNWPTKGETIKYTLIVIGVSLSVAAFLGGCDFIFTWLLEKFVLK
ncbi:preprotein translocase subunit SecE [Candidatus Falkowbacteria bacterium]|nr:preprotein translocase subunit SecE [Candidatus Falkowbacteria bacterium]